MEWFYVLSKVFVQYGRQLYNAFTDLVLRSNDTIGPNMVKKTNTVTRSVVVKIQKKSTFYFFFVRDSIKV